MQVRNRIKGLRWVTAAELRPHPRNWRIHPAEQQGALRGILAEIGYAGALLARELPDGSLQLIDGHLRAETTPDVEVPVLVVDLTDQETAKLLALHDPLSAMAETNADVLAELLPEVETENEALQALLHRMSSSADLDEGGGCGGNEEVVLKETFQVVIECGDEAEQQVVYERMKAEGYACRLLTL